MELLSVPPELGYCQTDCAAYAVTPDGSVTVGGNYVGPNPSSPSGFEVYAARWTDSGVDLIAAAAPKAISADGRVIVGGRDSVGGDNAIYWSEATGSRSIRDMLTNNGIDTSDWLELNSATGISADGRTIVGYGSRLDEEVGSVLEAWIMHIPEPSSIALVLSGLGVICGSRRRSTRRDIRFASVHRIRSTHVGTESGTESVCIGRNSP
jgi:hypothetical protein